MAAELGTAQGASAYASKQHADELASLRSTIEAQTHEIGKLRDERAGLMKRLMDQQKKLEDTKVDSEREKQELAYKLGKETALAALGASQTLSSGAANAMPSSPFRLTDAPSTVSSVRRGAGLRLGAQEKETKEETPAESSTAALLRELNLEPKSESAPDRAPTGASDVAATLETTTNSLLAKQEQLKQQELLLQALKQQQVQNRVLSAQAQRLQHQVHANHAPAQFASPRGASGPGFSPMGRYGAPHSGPHYGYNAPPTVSPSRAAYHPINAGPSAYGGAGYGSLGPSGMGNSARNVHGYSAPPGNSYGASPHYAAPPPPPHPYGASPQMYGAPPDTRRRLSLRDYSNSQDVGEYGPPEADVGQQMLPPPGSPVSQAPAYFPPPGGWTVYMHPPEGTKWPDTMAFFRPLVDTGIPVIKHGMCIH
jgi:chorismate mutase